MEERTQDLKTYLKKFEKKKIKILTKNNLNYLAVNLEVSDGFITFSDKFNDEIFLSFSELAQISEVKG